MPWVSMCWQVLGSRRIRYSHTRRPCITGGFQVPGFHSGVKAGCCNAIGDLCIEFIQILSEILVAFILNAAPFVKKYMVRQC